MSKRWLKVELHSHTLHSDGSQTREQLIEAARDVRGLDAVFLTDHNTQAGHIDPTAVEGMLFLPGLECTTFWGHILSLGTSTYIEWRDVNRATGGQILSDRIRAAGSLCGLAHPYALDTPFCTGCRFTYDQLRPDLFDYLEVWNDDYPPLHESELQAMELWRNWLDQGVHMPAVAGLDWHDTKRISGAAVTCVHAEKTLPGILASIRAGRVSVTMSDFLDLSINGQPIGSTVSGGGALRAEATVGERIALGDYAIARIELVTSRGRLPMAWTADGTACADLPPDARWAYAEGLGQIDGQPAMIAFTNAIYINSSFPLHMQSIL